MSKARAKGHVQVLDKLTAKVDGQHRLIEEMPLIVRDPFRRRPADRGGARSNAARLHRFAAPRPARAAVAVPALHTRQRCERVVIGQRLTRGSPDIFLGWVRQLADMKVSVKVNEHENANLSGFAEYCGLCGWALALAHAKSGDPAMIAGYCGTSGALDEAVGIFALAYAKQTEQDHAALRKAQRSGRIKVARGVV